MQVAEIHQRLPDLLPGLLLQAGPDSTAPDRLEIEAHIASGCSICARALVNAGAALADLATAATPAPPSASLRERILESSSLSHARRLGTSRGSDPGSERTRRAPDPSASVAHRHLTGPGEAERAREVEALGIHLPRATERPDWAEQSEGKATSRMLAQIEQLTGFPLLFVSIIRGERVGYLVQRGISKDIQPPPDIRREMTFCTHCVSAERPLVIENAGAEPFFRGNPAVQRVGIRSYVGVPLRTSRDIIIGTLCAMDYRKRSIPPEVVRVLELFAMRIVAEIERSRG